MRVFSMKWALLACLCVFAAGAVPASGWAASGNLTDCIVGCVPGDSACIECCRNAFDSQSSGTCCDAYADCNIMCENQEGTQAVACLKECRARLQACHAPYADMVREFDCPDWVAPKDCPFECQAWNPVSRKCVGAPQSVCD